MKNIKLLFVLLAMFSLVPGARAELQDQGLKSIMDILLPLSRQLMDLA